MKNVDEDMSVTYKSSSPVKILSKKVYYIDNENHQEEYTEGYVEKYTEKVKVEGFLAVIGKIRQSSSNHTLQRCY